MNREDQLLQELRKTLGKMELSLDAIEDAIVWVDEVGNLQWNNGRFSQLTHLSKIEILGKSIQTILPLEIDNKKLDWKKFLDSASSNAKPLLCQLEVDDTQKFLEVLARKFNIAGGKKNIIIVIHDVTEKYLNEEQIKKTNLELKKANMELSIRQLSKSKLAAIVESTDDAIIGRTLDGRIESWNKGAERLYGYNAEEVIGELATIIYPEDRKKEFYFSTEQAKKGITFEAQDTERVHKDGHIIPISVLVSPVWNDEGEIIGSCSIARDITELKKMINIKNDFISTVSHELRTPLTSIQGSLSLLVAGAGGKLPEKAENLLRIAEKNSERLIRLINDILDIQKIESGKMEFHYEPINMGTLVQEAFLANEAYAKQYHITINLIQKFTAMVNVDHDRILQVLANLISNAVKFSTASEITIRLFKKSKNIRVEVINTGVGIPKEFHSKIFHKFSQVKKDLSKTGTGLGLSISKEIIEKHHGKIGFESEENKETIFYFELPIFTKKLPDHQYYKKTPNVLICESDLKSANYLKSILEETGMNVIVTTTAQEVKSIIKLQRVDALLLDLLLPDEDGISLIKELKTSHPHLSVIVLSVASKEDKQKINGNAITVIDWIEKPIDLDRLVNSVQTLKKQTEKTAPNILHIEDDLDLMQIIASLLQAEANMYGVTTIREAKKMLDAKTFDLVILDLMLPDGYGIDLLPIISKKRIPILVFSAYELPKEFANSVVKTLVKAQTSPDEFLMNIKETIAKQLIET